MDDLINYYNRLYREYASNYVNNFYRCTLHRYYGTKKHIKEKKVGFAA